MLSTATSVQAVTLADVGERGLRSDNTVLCIDIHCVEPPDPNIPATVNVGDGSRHHGHTYVDRLPLKETPGRPKFP